MTAFSRCKGRLQQREILEGISERRAHTASDGHTTPQNHKLTVLRKASKERAMRVDRIGNVLYTSIDCQKGWQPILVEGFHLSCGPVVRGFLPRC